MSIKIKCVWEHNGNDSLLYASNFVGAFSRGESKEIAVDKMQKEISAYLRWKKEDVEEPLEVSVEQESASTLNICEADSPNGSENIW